VILTTMYLVLGGAMCLRDLCPAVHPLVVKAFDAPKAELCVKLTRILLPAQLCFFAGGVFGSCCWCANSSACRRLRR